MPMAIKIVYTEYTARNEIKLVNVPEPASKGKPIGTKLPVFVVSGFDLKICQPSIISNPKIKITIDPATANEPTSTPIMRKMLSPANKNAIIKKPANKTVCNGLNVSIFDLIDIIAGTDPITSIIANKVNETVIISDHANIAITKKF